MKHVTTCFASHQDACIFFFLQMICFDVAVCRFTCDYFCTMTLISSQIQNPIECKTNLSIENIVYARGMYVLWFWGKSNIGRLTLTRHFPFSCTNRDVYSSFFSSKILISSADNWFSTFLPHLLVTFANVLNATIHEIHMEELVSATNAIIAIEMS